MDACPRVVFNCVAEIGIAAFRSKKRESPPHSPRGKVQGTRGQELARRGKPFGVARRRAGAAQGEQEADHQPTAAKFVGLADVSRRFPFERSGGSLFGASCVVRRSDAYRWKASWVVEFASFSRGRGGSHLDPWVKGNLFPRKPACDGGARTPRVTRRQRRTRIRSVRRGPIPLALSARAAEAGNGVVKTPRPSIASRTRP